MPPEHDNLGGERPTSLVSVPIEVTVSVGQARPTVRDLLALEKDAVLTLDRKIEDPVELYVGAHLIARGVLEEAEDGAGLCVRLTDVISPEKAF